MTDSGSVSEEALKFCLGGGEVLTRLRALHAQLPEAPAKDELFRTALTGNARKGPMELCGVARTANAARVCQRGCSDVQAEQSAGSTEANQVSLSPPFLGRERRDFFPV
jgi:hypothetical protein